MNCNSNWPKNLRNTWTRRKPVCSSVGRFVESNKHQVPIQYIYCSIFIATKVKEPLQLFTESIKNNCSLHSFPRSRSRSFSEWIVNSSLLKAERNYTISSSNCSTLILVETINTLTHLQHHHPPPTANRRKSNNLIIGYLFHPPEERRKSRQNAVSHENGTKIAIRLSRLDSICGLYGPGYSISQLHRTS